MTTTPAPQDYPCFDKFGIKIVPMMVIRYVVTVDGAPFGEHTDLYDARQSIADLADLRHAASKAASDV